MKSNPTADSPQSPPAARLSDVAAERGVLAAVARGGYRVFVDVDDILSSTSFTVEPAQVLYATFRALFSADHAAVPDVPLVMSTAGQLGYADFVSRNADYLRAVFLLAASTDPANARKLARRVAKLAHLRDLRGVLQLTLAEVDALTGGENLGEVLTGVEGRVLDFGRRTAEDDGPVRLGLGAGAYLEELMASNRQMSVPSGFARWDASHGGGFLPNCLDLVGARTKVGKSMFGLSVAVNVARAGVPVLMLDTEMTRDEQIRRAAANVAEVPEHLLREGKLGSRPELVEALRASYRELEDLSVDHYCVASKSLSEIVAGTRRWMLTRAGLDDRGRVNPSLVIYDYFKLTSGRDVKKELAEYQAMGFMATEMKNLMAKYHGRCMAFVQLNREGIDREDEAAIAQSDRLAWFCTSFSQLRWLSKEEAGALPRPGLYTHKLLPILSRHGNRFRPGEFVYLHSDLGKCRMWEGPTCFEEGDGGAVALPDDAF